MADDRSLTRFGNEGRQVLWWFLRGSKLYAVFESHHGPRTLLQPPTR